MESPRPSSIVIGVLPTGYARQLRWLRTPAPAFAGPEKPSGFEGTTSSCVVPATRDEGAGTREPTSMLTDDSGGGGVGAAAAGARRGRPEAVPGRGDPGGRRDRALRGHRRGGLRRGRAPGRGAVDCAVRDDPYEPHGAD